MNEAKLLALVDDRDFRELFISELGWHNPDRPELAIETEGQTFALNQIAGYKGLRIWHCGELPPRRIQRAIDDIVGRESHERLIIFSDAERQEWRWPRRAELGGVNAKLLAHRHTTGEPDDHLARQLQAIEIDFDANISLVELLSKMRLAFDTESETASVQAARLMGTLYNELELAGWKAHDATLLLTRLLFLLFGDDSGMWKTGLFERFLKDHTTEDTLEEALRILFEVVDTDDADRTVANGSPYAEFRYINGGIFADPIDWERLTPQFRVNLLEASEFNWSVISPAVFGSMFQTVKSKEARRHGGEHYTTEKNILRTIEPLFLNELRTRLAAAWNDRGQLTKLHNELGRLRLLDPACGCGNFLIVAYRELRALELDLMLRKRELEYEAKRGDFAQLSFDVSGEIKVTLDHFYGIEIEEWPARIAETALLLIDHLANQRMADDFGSAPDRLPIRIAPKIVRGSALALAWDEVVSSDELTHILGNPPFIGISLRSERQTAELRAVWGANYHGTLDYVSAWYKKVVDYGGSRGVPAALVSTNSITQGEQVAPLWDSVFAAGYQIAFAHQTFAWRSEARGAAQVHVVIIGIAKGPRNRTLYEYPKISGDPVERSVSSINPYLIEADSGPVHGRLRPLAPDLPQVSYGNKPTDDGNLIIERDEIAIFRADPVATKYVRRYIGARELIHNEDRWCLWLADLVPGDLAKSELLRSRVDSVAAFREASTATVTREYGRPTLFRQISQPTSRYLGIPIHVSEDREYFPSGYFGPEVIASNANFVAPDPHGIAFAVISSSMFLSWQRAVGGRLESRLRFNKLLTWNTFPLPLLTPEQRAHLSAAGGAVLAARAQNPDASLAFLYARGNIPDSLLDAHRAIDRIVDPLISGGAGIATDSDRLRALFARYQELISDGQLQPATPVRRRRRAPSSNP